MTTLATQRSPRFPRLPGRIAFAAWWSLAAALGAENPADSVYRRDAAHPTAAAGGGTAAEAAAQAERIVVASLATLAEPESVSLRLRQRARVGDRVLVGAGRYVQAGHGEQLRFRFESALTCDTETFQVTEVCDGLFCWLHRRTGPDPASLQRIDVQSVRTRLTEMKAANPSDTARHLGGLQRVLWNTREWYGFATAEPGEFEGRPAWLVEGRWLPERLAALEPKLAEAATRPGGIAPHELPDGLPWAVRLTIGRDDLVPRRLEMLAIPGPRPVATDAPIEPIAVIEFLEIELGGSVDAAAFFYQPAEQGLIDLTAQHCRGLYLPRP